MVECWRSAGGDERGRFHCSRDFWEKGSQILDDDLYDTDDRTV